MIGPVVMQLTELYFTVGVVAVIALIFVAARDS